MRLFRTTILALLAVGTFAVGCGGGNSDNAQNPSQQINVRAGLRPKADIPPAKAKKVRPAPGEANLNSKPKVTKGKGSPPKKLVVQDLIVGKGKEAESGSLVWVQYVGRLFNGKQFDATWKGNRPGEQFRFTLATAQVIPGWDLGIVGMRVGGRRKLIIPPKLAYGAQGYPPQIPPNSTLIFDVDLKKVSG